tara:strand:+ start:53 stop:547 length:495 start_codon:yes stop_codon:yes gene_type:complete
MKLIRNFFLLYLVLLNQISKKKNLKLALYYPANFEINVLKLLENKYMSDKKILLPVTEKNNKMNFFSWKKNHVLLVNNYGMLEPLKSKVKIPNLLLVPILVFDRDKYRLGYGKGFYDRYLNKYLKKCNNILTVGVAFSFQRYHKLPRNKNDVKLDYILTEKGIC